MTSSQESLEKLLSRHQAFFTQAETCISADKTAVHNDAYNAFLSLLLCRIKAHRANLQAAEQNKHAEKDAVPWGPILVSRDDREGTGLVLTVLGPAAGDKHNISARSEEDAHAMVRFDIHSPVPKYGYQPRLLLLSPVQETQLQQYNKMVSNDNSWSNTSHFVHSGYN